MNHEPTDAEVLSRVVTYEPPPSGFDPLTASDKLLHKHGFPHRPDPKKEPRLSAFWQKTFSRSVNMIKAELEVDHSRPARDPRQPVGRPGFTWAGGQVNNASLGFNPPEPANSVYGQWIVPNILPFANPPQQDLFVGFWVGLGGDQNNNSQPVVQAGTQAVLGQDNKVSYSAFTQWYPYQPSAIKVSNFEVRPGQRVEFLVTTPQPDRAFISMQNLSTQVATTVKIDPVGITNDGTSAEWIVEGDGPLLADFFAVLFGQCIGGTKNHDFDLSVAFPREIISLDGSTVLASGSIIRPNEVVVVWQGSGP